MGQYWWWFAVDELSLSLSSSVVVVEDAEDV